MLASWMVPIVYFETFFGTAATNNFKRFGIVKTILGVYGIHRNVSTNSNKFARPDIGDPHW